MYYKNLLIILLIVCLGKIVFGQNDSIKHKIVNDSILSIKQKRFLDSINTVNKKRKRDSILKVYDAKKNEDLINWLDLIFEYNTYQPQRISLGINNFKGDGFVVRGPFLTMDIEKPYFKSDVIGIRAGYYSTYVLLSCRGSLGYYTDFKKSNFVIIPEFGLTFLTCFSIYWGLYIPFNKNFDYCFTDKTSFLISSSLIHLYINEGLNTKKKKAKKKKYH